MTKKATSVKLPEELAEHLAARGVVSHHIVSDLQAIRAIRHSTWATIEERFTESDLESLKKALSGQIPLGGYRTSSTTAAEVASAWGCDEEITNKVRELNAAEMDALYTQLEY